MVNGKGFGLGLGARTINIPRPFFLPIKKIAD
jgi:hypothetical protein